MSDISNNKMSSGSDKEVNYDGDHHKYHVNEQPTARAKYSVLNTWYLFSSAEKRNIAIYILGIMLYKFGLEAFNGSLIALATNRYDYDAKLKGVTPNTFERIGLLVGLNQAFQW